MKAEAAASTVKEGLRPGYTIIHEYPYRIPAADGKVDPGATKEAVRLDVWLQKLDPDRFPSSTSAKKNIRKGMVVVEGKRCTLETMVRPGIDRISLQARTTSPYQPAGTAPFNIAIVYEDDSMAIVHKPRGVCSHPSPGGMDGNMTMRFCVPYWVQGAPEGSVGMLWRPMLVHRLDKETEGLQPLTSEP
ncbi:hypothetical protein T484DRAFT_1779968 [Baffinella frigidus]|nr:hypothetical protein T484DRAFT_1779968 [Cryptophyta sp. CCMP2293]